MRIKVKDEKTQDSDNEKIKVNREELINVLEQVQIGLAAKELVQQASCFVFKEGRVFTFNEELACQAKTLLPKGFTGAVNAVPLLSILRKLPEQFVKFGREQGNLIIYGTGKKTKIVMEGEITLPLEMIETPKKDAWRKLHGDFTDAIGIVQECAGKDQTAWTFTCIHVHPKFVEACDNLQLSRYRIKTGIDKPFLVRRDSLKHVSAFDFTEFAETETWIHFRNPNSKMMMSCKKYNEKFEDFSYLMEEKGSPTILPKALGKAAERCAIFSSESSEDDLLLVELKKGKLRVTGEGATGEHSEVKKLKYNGDEMTFRISPKLLVELLKRYSDCEISKRHRLKVNGGKFTYVACLQPNNQTAKE